MHERLVELFSLRGEFLSDTHVDPGFAQGGESAAGDERIRILHGGDHVLHAGGGERFDAGGRPSMVRARLEIDVQLRAASLIAGLLEREDLGVLHAGVSVEPSADYFAAAHGPGADHRVRAGLPASLARQLQRLADVCGVHCSKIDWMYFSGSKGSRSSTFSPIPT